MSIPAQNVVEDDVMQNMLQQLNWALLLSRRTKGCSPSHHYKKAWRRLLTTILNVQNEFSGGGLSEKLEVALARLHHSNGDCDSLAITSLREFACVIEAQSGKRIQPMDANTLVNATQEIIDVLMSG